MTTSSLGEMLRQKIERDKQDAINEQQRKENEAKVAGARAERIVRTFFASAQASFEADILAERAVKPLEVRHRTNGEVAEVIRIYSTPQIDNRRHQYHKYWAEFADWARANGLQANWTYAHDGMGVDSWQILSVTPA